MSVYPVVYITNCVCAVETSNIAFPHPMHLRSYTIDKAKKVPKSMDLHLARKLINFNPWIQADMRNWCKSGQHDVSPTTIVQKPIRSASEALTMSRGTSLTRVVSDRARHGVNCEVKKAVDRPAGKLDRWKPPVCHGSPARSISEKASHLRALGRGQESYTRMNKRAMPRGMTSRYTFPPTDQSIPDWLVSRCGILGTRKLKSRVGTKSADVFGLAQSTAGQRGMKTSSTLRKLPGLLPYHVETPEESTSETNKKPSKVSKEKFEAKSINTLIDEIKGRLKQQSKKGLKQTSKQKSKEMVGKQPKKTKAGMKAKTDDDQSNSTLHFSTRVVKTDTQPHEVSTKLIRAQIARLREQLDEAEGKSVKPRGDLRPRIRFLTQKLVRAIRSMPALEQKQTPEPELTAQELRPTTKKTMKGPNEISKSARATRKQDLETIAATRSSINVKTIKVNSQDIKLTGNAQLSLLQDHELRSN